MPYPCDKLGTAPEKEKNKKRIKEEPLREKTKQRVAAVERVSILVNE